MNTHDRTHRACTFIKVSENFLSFLSLLLLVSLRYHFIERNAKNTRVKYKSELICIVSISAISFSLFIQAES